MIEMVYVIYIIHCSVFEIHFSLTDKYQNKTLVCVLVPQQYQTTPPNWPHLLDVAFLYHYTIKQVK